MYNTWSQGSVFSGSLWYSPEHQQKYPKHILFDFENKLAGDLYVLEQQTFWMGMI